MVAPRRITIVSCLVLIVVLAVVIGLWSANRIEVRQPADPEQSTRTVEKVQTRSQATKSPSLIGSLHIASPPIEAAMNEAKWPSASKAHVSSPADTFVASMSALARGDLRTFALAMSKPAQAAFLEGRSIDDPYFQMLPQKMAEAGFQSPTVESFNAERMNGGCKLIATLSSVRGRQKISEEITMELSDSPSGWLIEKYESRTAKREAVIEEK
ncbi:MAG: hypothetical protein R3F31_19485 [Verrucomicrobiales bacterium]|nr:hypothetical protein [Verrucomicrobiae bacterium]MCP5553671.1 hypothetical protein [Akkermansiaceae bacterium]HRX55770.1 hypothetical protein [Verrucomicrobiales bacterium]